ncbi:glycosyltransferase family 4 protein [Candidatus Sumerlaeota bacterium]|nr:glycosyltransferase family 4 protein [Candidatus Sumerlaeota bacterium]
MKILVYTPLFFPSVGGLENMMRWLAEDFARAGEEVKVVCHTTHDGVEPFDFEVIRFPKRDQLITLAKWCDVYFQGCVSLKGLWPLLLAPRARYAVTHQTWYVPPGSNPTLAGRLKQAATKRAAVSVSCSSAIAHALNAPSTVIPNCYDDQVFRRMGDTARTRDFVFAGRLVSDKGADLILEAARILAEKGFHPSITIVGGGPEEAALKQRAIDLKLDQVQFAGIKRGADLAAVLNMHRVMIVPSRWPEPFGIVALEGIACGCAIIASEGGGLPEAVGSCGVLFPNGDAVQLADRMISLLESSEKIRTLAANAEDHLPHFQRKTVAGKYLELFRNA